MKSKYISILISYLFAIIAAQDLEHLSFGDEHSLDIATWNIEWFPKNNQITVDYVIEIINLLNDSVVRFEIHNDEVYQQLYETVSVV